MKQLFFSLPKKLGFVSIFCFVLTSFLSTPLPEQIAKAEIEQQVETLNRGLVAVKSHKGIFLSWRLLGTEDKNTVFHIYRDGKKIADPIVNSTNYFDSTGTTSSSYYIRTIRNGVEQTQSESVTPWKDNFYDIPLKAPDIPSNQSDKFSYTVTYITITDVDDDGQYEIILKWTPSHKEEVSNKNNYLSEYIECYELNGTRKWQVDLKDRISENIDNSQVLAYDFDGDGYGEVAIISLEYITILEGNSGKYLTSSPIDWNNESIDVTSTFLGSVSYLQSSTPHLIICGDMANQHIHKIYVYKGGKLAKEEDIEYDYNHQKLTPKEEELYTIKSLEPSPYYSSDSSFTYYVDLLGDWREEALMFLKDSSSLRISTINTLTNLKFITPMHNTEYRCGIANQSESSHLYKNNSAVFLKSIGTNPNVYAVGSYTESPVYGISENIIKEGLYYIKNASTGKYLDLAIESSGNGIILQENRHSGTDLQKFLIRSNGDGYYYILTGSSNYNDCLEVDGGNSANNTNITQWLYHGGDMQMFHIVKNTDNTYTLLTKASSNTSAIASNILWKDTLGAIIQKTYIGDSTQHWYLELVN